MPPCDECFPHQFTPGGEVGWGLPSLPPERLRDKRPTVSLDCTMEHGVKNSFASFDTLASLVNMYRCFWASYMLTAGPFTTPTLLLEGIASLQRFGKHYQAVPWRPREKQSWKSVQVPQALFEHTLKLSMTNHFGILFSTIAPTLVGPWSLGPSKWSIMALSPDPHSRPRSLG